MVLNQLVRPRAAMRALELEAAARGCARRSCFRGILAASPSDYASRLRQTDLALDSVSALQIPNNVNFLRFLGAMEWDLYNTRCPMGIYAGVSDARWSHV